MRRRFVIALLVGIALAPLLSAGAAEPPRMFHVGMVNLNSPRSAPFNVAFEQRLRELGWMDTSIALRKRWKSWSVARST